MADGVARGAVRGKGIAAAVTDINCRRLLISCLGINCLCMTPVAEPVPNHVRQEPRIVCGGVAHPLAARFVADQHAWSVSIAIIRIGLAVKTQLLADEVNIGFLSCEERPSRADV